MGRNKRFKNAGLRNHTMFQNLNKIICIKQLSGSSWPNHLLVPPDKLRANTSPYYKSSDKALQFVGLEFTLMKQTFQVWIALTIRKS